MSRDRLGRRISLVVTGTVLVFALPLAASAASEAAGPSAAPSPAVVAPAPSGAAGPTAGDSAAGAPIPVFAYFYQWFTGTSWNRAKQDFPLIGKYSSDDARVLRTQVQQARAAGIDGFLTSWKDTPALDRRLQLLINVARSERLDLGVVYEALDFTRKPLPVATVEHDLRLLVATYGASLRSTYFGRVIVIWTGTDLYSAADVATVRAALGDKVYLLAASKTVAGYQRIASSVDGEAYYWSSADPRSATTLIKLKAIGAAVHANHGLWIAPAAPGFDGRTLGSTRVIDRDNGQTLVLSLDNAFASAPDAVGVISWNEWSENTYIEPGENYGDRELSVLRNYLQSQGRGLPDNVPVDSSEGDLASSWTGARAVVSLAVIALAGLALLGLRRRRGSGRHAARSPKRDAANRTDAPAQYLPPRERAGLGGRPGQGP